MPAASSACGRAEAVPEESAVPVLVCAVKAAALLLPFPPPPQAVSAMARASADAARVPQSRAEAENEKEERNVMVGRLSVPGQDARA